VEACSRESGEKSKKKGKNLVYPYPSVLILLPMIAFLSEKQEHGV